MPLMEEDFLFRAAILFLKGVGVARESVLFEISGCLRLISGLA